jgi:hypothetical protein
MRPCLSSASLLLILVIFALACLARVQGRTVDEVLASMSLEAKIGQMVQLDISFFMVPNSYEVNSTFLHEYVKQYQIGSILNSPFSQGPIDGESGLNATQWRMLIKDIQSASSETTSGT